MNELSNALQQANAQDLLKQSGLSADVVTTAVLAGTIVTLVFAILNCFFGLKLVKVWSALLGLGIGFGLGYGISTAFNLDNTIALIIGAVAAIVFAVLGVLWLVKVFMFLIVWVTMLIVVIAVVPSSVEVGIAAIIGAVVGLIVAILSVKFFEPIVILVTAICGGLTAGSSIGTLANLSGMIPLIIGIALAVLGVIVQFALESHKKVKEHKVKAQEIREKESTASEVERARGMIDHLEDDDDITVITTENVFDDEDE